MVVDVGNYTPKSQIKPIKKETRFCFFVACDRSTILFNFLTIFKTTKSYPDNIKIDMKGKMSTYLPKNSNKWIS